MSDEQKDVVHCLIESYQKDIHLPGGESNSGLPRDRRGYLPLYYRGVICTKLKCGLVDIGLPIRNVIGISVPDYLDR